MDSQDIALAIAGGGLLLGVARLGVSIASYRLDVHRSRKNAPGTTTRLRQNTLTRAESHSDDGAHDDAQVV